MSNNAESGLTAQLTRLLGDQEIALKELRRKRREMREEYTKLDSEEIDILLSIRTIKEELEKREASEIK